MRKFEIDFSVGRAFLTYDVKVETLADALRSFEFWQRPFKSYRILQIRSGPILK